MGIFSGKINVWCYKNHTVDLKLTRDIFNYFHGSD